MATIEVDPDRRIARVGAGATWSQFDRATQPHGLATTGGRVSTTGVAGLTLGGGSGWLERKHGLACDNLLAVELVTADGEHVRASAGEHPDLFWALRGGGGNFGVVTAFEFRLHPLEREVFAGLALYPAARGRELLALYRDVMRDAPEGLSLAFLYLKAPAEEGIPEHLHGELVVAIAGMYAGPLDEGREALREIRAAGAGGRLLRADAVRGLPVHDRRPAGLPELLDVGAPGRPARRGDRGDRAPLGGDARRASRSCSWSAGAARSPASARTPRRCPPATRASSCTRSACGRTRPTTPPTSRGRAAFRDDLAAFSTGAVYLNFIGDEGEARVRAGYGPGELRAPGAGQGRVGPGQRVPGQRQRPAADGASRRRHERDRRLIVGAVGISALGDFLLWIPLTLHIHELTGSGAAVAALMICLWGPIVLLAPAAGLLADRVRDAAAADLGVARPGGRSPPRSRSRSTRRPRSSRWRRCSAPASRSPSRRSSRSSR